MSDLHIYRLPFPKGVPTPKSKRARIRKKWFLRAIRKADLSIAERLNHAYAVRFLGAKLSMVNVLIRDGKGRLYMSKEKITPLCFERVGDE